MNYHIMIQDKFLDVYIEDVYAIHQENNNIFWFRGYKGEKPYLKTTRPVEFLGEDKQEWKKRLSELDPEDNIFIHWYDMWVGELVYDLPNKIFVMFWGGDFYQDPYWYHAGWALDKKTYKLMKSKLYPKLRLNKQLPKNIKTAFYNWIVLPRKTREEYELKHKYVARIDYIMMGELNKPDVNKIKELYPNFKAVHLPSFYELNFDICSTADAKVPDKTNMKILVGNSATEANNHIEAFDILSKIENIKVYCPLSYGNETYKEYIIAYGKKVFGDRFYPIVDFMNIDDYVNLLNDMDVIYMFHNRSQALANIAACLTLGKPVFMKSCSPTKKYMDLIGVKIYDVYDILDYDLEQLCKENYTLSREIYPIMERAMSRDKRLSDLSNIMQNYTN